MTLKGYIVFTTDTTEEIGFKRARINFGLFELGCRQMGDMQALEIKRMAGCSWESGENTQAWFLCCEFSPNAKAHL